MAATLRHSKRPSLSVIPPVKEKEPESLPAPSQTGNAFEWDILVLATCIKLLLFPAYRSTDFEVHRNWLAITHSLPMSKWYFEATSEWTLDYPPFFAYFEYILSIPASIIDPKIVDVKNLGYDSWTVVVFQRSTVIITELVLAFALRSLIRSNAGSNPHHDQIQRIIAASLFLHPGFLIIDHIHFQYNGFLFGILLWSLIMARKGNQLACGLLFAVLLNFKHIYMYLAPPYFVYLLRSYCMTPQGSPAPLHFLTLAQGVLLVFGLSFGPFALIGADQIPQILSRLFPFKRGLNHAYWAPNVWSLVTASDRILLKLLPRLQRIIPGLSANAFGVESTSRGLIGDTIFAVLPNVKPIHTFVITVLLQATFLIKLYRNPNYKSFLASLTLCGYVSYLFGWHVHEKAVLLILVPLSLMAGEGSAHFRIFMIASVSGVFSLFPLLFTPAESIVKIIYSLLWYIAVFPSLSKQLYEFPSTPLGSLVDLLERAYLVNFVLLQIICSLIPIWAGEDLEFLPLLLTSIYCAVGLVWAFLRLSFLYLNTTY